MQPTEFSNFLGEVLLNLAKLIPYKGHYIEQARPCHFSLLEISPNPTLTCAHVLCQIMVHICNDPPMCPAWCDKTPLCMLVKVFTRLFLRSRRGFKVSKLTLYGLHTDAGFFRETRKDNQDGAAGMAKCMQFHCLNPRQQV